MHILTWPLNRFSFKMKLYFLSGQFNLEISIHFYHENIFLRLNTISFDNCILVGFFLKLTSIVFFCYYLILVFNIYKHVLSVAVPLPRLKFKLYMNPNFFLKTIIMH